jgi:drug/metabolite transporter (DMT)-like permease
MTRGGRRRWSRALALLAAMAAISFAAPFFRKAAPTPPLSAAAIRLAIASLFLLPWTVRALASGRLRGPLLRAAALGGLLYAVHFGAWVTSLALTSIAASVTLVTTTPLLLALAGAVTGRDRPEPRLWRSLALAVVGLLIVGGRDLSLGREALAGDALALLGAFAMAAFLANARRLGQAMELGAFAGTATGVGALVLFAASALAGVPLRPASTAALGYLALAALVPQLVGHNLMTWAVRDAKAATVAMTVVGEPAGATILGWLWLGEAVPPWTMVGCAITLAAVVLAASEQHEDTAPLPT